MRVDDEVRHNAFLREGHVLLRVRDADGSLLAVATGKLVSHLGDANGADLRHGEGGLTFQTCTQMPSTLVAMKAPIRSSKALSRHNEDAAWQTKTTMPPQISLRVTAM